MSHHSHEYIHNDHELDFKEQHNMNMWKGLVAMMGLALFFFTEKALTMLAEWRKLRQRRNKVIISFKLTLEININKNINFCKIY